MSGGQDEILPVFDVEDARLVGWEWGQADDGDYVVPTILINCWG
jgi:hypothetical protein